MRRAEAWACEGNVHLLNHIRREVGVHARPGGQDLAYGAGAMLDRNVKRLVAAKDAWVADMVDLDTGKGVPVEIQQSIWEDYLTRAEAQREGACPWRRP